MERQPLAEVRIPLQECVDIELFALQSLYMERIRHSMEVLEDIDEEITRRQG